MAENRADTTKLDIIQDAGRLWYSTVVEQVTAFVRGLIIPGLLGPVHYGIVGGLNLIIQYGQYADIGITNGLYRELPMYAARGDRETAAGLTRSAFAFNLLTTVALTVVIAAAAFAVKARVRTASFWGLLSFAFVFFLYRLTVFYQTYLRARLDFKSVGRSIALRGIITLAAVVGLTYYFGIYGLYVGLIVAGVAVCFYVYSRSGTGLSIAPEKRYLSRLLRVGVPYFAVNLVGYFMVSVDRVVVFNLLPKAEMGYYTLAAVITSFVYSVPMNIGQVLGPRVFGIPRDGDLAGFKTYLLKPTILMTVFSSLLGGATILLLIPLLRYVLPDYVPSMALIPPMFVAFTVLNGTHGSGLILIALHRFKLLTVANLAAAGLITAASCLAIAEGSGLFWVALSAAAGITAYSVFLQLAVWRALRLRTKAGVQAVFYLFFPPGLMASALFAAFFGSNILLGPITPSPTTFVWDLTYLVIRLAMYFVVSGGLLYYAEKRTGIISLVVGSLRSTLAEMASARRNADG